MLVAIVKYAEENALKLIAFFFDGVCLSLKLLPFFCGDCSSSILLLKVLHEVIRKHSIAAGARVKEEGLSNDLLDRIRKDPAFSSIHDKLDETVDAKLFVGRAPEQVMDFVMTEVRPELERRAVDMSFTGEVTV